MVSFPYVPPKLVVCESSGVGGWVGVVQLGGKRAIGVVGVIPGAR